MLWDEVPWCESSINPVLEHIPEIGEVERILLVNRVAEGAQNLGLLASDNPTRPPLLIPYGAAVVMAPVHDPLLNREGAAKIEQQLGVWGVVRAYFCHDSPAGCVVGEAPGR